MKSLRDEKNEAEEEQLQRTKEIESLKKEKELLGRKLKMAEGALTSLQMEMVQCQREKQAKLNEISTCAVLKPSQIHIADVDSASLRDRDVTVMSGGTLRALEARPQVIGRLAASTIEDVLFLGTP